MAQVDDSLRHQPHLRREIAITSASTRHEEPSKQIARFAVHLKPNMGGLTAGRIHCGPYHSVRAKFVSGESLLKTGTSAVLAGDFRQFLARVAFFRRLETCYKCVKTPQNAGFSPTRCSLSLVERVAGWRRSADRACLRIDSLLTGNFTGNFAILARRDRAFWPESAALQPLLRRFPIQPNREIFSGNREFSSCNRECRWYAGKRPFLAHFSCGS
jgi:hypothetical protein